MRYKIEELVDKEILGLVLEAFLARWPGTFDVRPADTDDPKEYLFNPKSPAFADFCSTIKGKDERICIECDRKHAHQAKQAGKPIHYICDAGLLDIAVPIIVEDELVATIFCGQCRSWVPGDEELGAARARAIAKKLDLNPDQLVELRTKARETTEIEVEHTKARLWRVATYMATVGSQKAELLRVQDARQRLLEDVGHQLIAPLAGIQGECYRIVSHYQRLDEERQRRGLLKIRDMSRWAVRLTRNLIWAATKDSHKIVLRRAKLTPILIGCATDAQGVAKAKRMTVFVDTVEADRLPKLRLDRDKISQAILNIIDNGVKYGSTGTKVSVDCQQVAGFVELRITNEGIPLHEADVERVFQRSYRAKEAISRIPSGTGIGLAVAREILEAHGGSVSVSPSILQPSRLHLVTFVVQLPLPDEGQI